MRRLLAVLRILAGLLLVFASIKKWSVPAFFQMEGLAKELALSGKPFPFYQTLLDAYIFPHAALFATLAAAGESAVGLSLLLGAFTNPLSIVGMFMVLNYSLATCSGRPGGFVGHIVFTGLVGLFGIYSSGMVWGLDAFLARVLSPRLVLFPFGGKRGRAPAK